MSILKYLTVFLVGTLILPLCIYLALLTGVVPVATSSTELPFEKSIARMAIRGRVNREKPSSVPLDASEGTLTQGAALYRVHCAFCHGLPNRPASTASIGMFPKPPQFFVRKGAPLDPAAVYWKVGNGIRMSGMPGFGATLQQDQLWQLAVFVANTSKLPPAVQETFK